MHWLALEQGDWIFPELQPNSTGGTHLLLKPGHYLGSVESRQTHSDCGDSKWTKLPE